MAYLLCLVYIALTYIRPGEISPAMAKLHLIQIAGVATAVVTVFSLLLKPRRFADLPIDWCLLGFCAALLLSRPANGDFSNWSVIDILVPVVCSYFFIRAAVQTRRQLQVLIVLVVLLTTFQAANVIVQHVTGTGLIGNVALKEDVEGTAEKTLRGVGVGMYGDPNDLAMMMVIVLPFLLTTVFSRVPGTFRRLIGIGTVAVLGYGVVLTQSRGGIIGLGALCGAYWCRRFGRASAIVVAVVVLAAGVVYGSTRIQHISTTAATAQQRFQSWGEAIYLLKSKPVLGVGYGRFTELNGGLDAHNSFVHAMADSGLVGGFFFVGMFYWLIVTNGRRRDIAGAATSSLALDIWASGIGIIVCACFLSRQNIPAFYVPLALGAARVAVERTPDSESSVQRAWDWVLIAFLTFGVVLTTRFAVRIFAVWGP